MQLIVDNSLVCHLFLILIQKFLSHFIIILIHFSSLEFFPLLLQLSIDLLLALSQLLLHVTLLHDIAHHHLAVESLDLILGIVHVLVSSFNCLKSCLDLEFILESINLSPLYFFLFKSSNSFLVFFLPESLYSVGPVLYSSFWLLLQIKSLLSALCLFIKSGVTDRALLPYTLQFVVTNNSCVLIVRDCRSIGLNSLISKSSAWFTSLGTHKIGSSLAENTSRTQSVGWESRLWTQTRFEWHIYLLR